MLSKTKHSIAVAAAILAATSPVALAASGDPGAGPSQSAQAATSGGGNGARAYRHCYRVVYGGSVRWRCVWR
jgi:hypothetical protein